MTEKKIAALINRESKAAGVSPKEVYRTSVNSWKISRVKGKIGFKLKESGMATTDIAKLFGEARPTTDAQIRKYVKNKDLRFGKITRSGKGDEVFIIMDEEGRIRIKDGRTLEAYLNHPYQMERRASLGLGTIDLVIVSAQFFRNARVPKYLHYHDTAGKK